MQAFSPPPQPQRVRFYTLLDLLRQNFRSENSEADWFHELELKANDCVIHNFSHHEPVLGFSALDNAERDSCVDVVAHQQALECERRFHGTWNPNDLDNFEMILERCFMSHDQHVVCFFFVK